MGAAVPLRTDFRAGELRQSAKRAEDADQARRLLSLAAVLDGMSRKVLERANVMNRETLPSREPICLVSPPRREAGPYCRRQG